jgi:hypothetical protein
MVAYGSSPVSISHITIPNENTSTCMSFEKEKGMGIKSSIRKLNTLKNVC